MTSAIVPTLAFFGIRIGKGVVLGRARVRSGLKMLFVGSIAAPWPIGWALVCALLLA